MIPISCLVLYRMNGDGILSECEDDLIQCIRKEDPRSGEQNIRECLVDRTKTAKKPTPTERNKAKDDVTKTLVPKKGSTTRKKKTDGQNGEQMTTTPTIKSLTLLLEKSSGREKEKKKVIEDENVVLGKPVKRKAKKDITLVDDEKNIGTVTAEPQVTRGREAKRRALAKINGS